MCEFQRTLPICKKHGGLDPIRIGKDSYRKNSKRMEPTMVGLIGLEPMTLRLSSACSNQLSYRPKIDMEARGFEPLTSSLQSWRSTN